MWGMNSNMLLKVLQCILGTMTERIQASRVQMIRRDMRVGIGEKGS
jgi:hypothetical protein